MVRHLAVAQKISAEFVFSGRRITGAKTRSQNEAVIFSDIIGIAGILRTGSPEAFGGNDASFPQKVKIIRFNDLYRCRPENSDCPGIQVIG